MFDIVTTNKIKYTNAKVSAQQQCRY